jgi:malate dehydrogenase (oxaloacetate-decarboxylating)
MYVQLHSLTQENLLHLCSQGTGAVTLACILAAIRISSHSSSHSTKPKARLSDQRFVIFGAGSAGMGITVQLRDAMMTTDGISREDANRRFWIIDKEGLLYEDSGVDEEEKKGSDRTKELRREFYRPKKEDWTKDSSGMVSLLDVVRGASPTVLIGASTRAGAFTEEVVRAMVDGLEANQRPIILPLSNPSRLTEARPEDILKWTGGTALVATGSPFGTVKVNVGQQEREVT